MTTSDSSVPPGSGATKSGATKSGATKSGATRSGSGKGGWRGPAALGIAAVALLVALLSTTVAWRATSRVGDLQDTVDALASARPSAAAPAPEPAAEPSDAAQPPAEPPAEPSAEPTDPPTGSVPVLDAQTQYEVRYTKKRMKIPAGCNDNVYVDLDEPLVQADYSVAELTYYDSCGTTPPTFKMSSDEISGSAVESDAIKPVDCNERIKLSPLSHSTIAIRQGQVYCLRTSIAATKTTGLTWKMIVVSVTAMGQDGTVSIEANAWDIPQN